jgi:GNAT superfamily N-acetyltransferase
MLRLQHYLYLALLIASLGCFLAAGNVSWRKVPEGNVSEAERAAAASAGGVYWILISAGFVPLAAALLIRALVREERTQALLRAQETAPLPKPLPLPNTGPLTVPIPDSRTSARFLSSALHPDGAGAGDEGHPREPVQKGTAVLPLIPPAPIPDAGTQILLKDPPPSVPTELAPLNSSDAALAQFPGGTVADWHPAHADAFLSMWNASCTHLYSATPKTAAELEKLLDSPEFDPECSVVALGEKGELLGVTLMLRQPEFEEDGYWWLESPAVLGVMLVDPAMRKRWIGRAMLREVEARAKRAKRPRVIVGGLENFPAWVPGVPSQDHTARVFFLALGYREIRKTVHMEAPVGGFQIPQELKEREERLLSQGYKLSAASIENADAFLDFVERSQWPRPQRMIDRFKKAPGHFGLAWNGEQICGFVQVLPPDAQGRAGIKVIYLPDDARGLGLGSLLLMRTHELWEKLGAKTASLWTYPEAAERFYPRAGFAPVQEWTCFVKDIPHAWGDEEFVNRWRT